MFASTSGFGSGYALLLEIAPILCPMMQSKRSERSCLQVDMNAARRKVLPSGNVRHSQQLGSDASHEPQ